MRVKPSELYLISDPLAAFYFDRAVCTFGMEVQEAMDEAAEGSKTTKDSKRKRQMVFAKYMRDATGAPVPGTFRDPAARH